MGPPPPLPGATDVVAVSAGLVSTLTLTDDEVDGVVLVSELPLLLLPQPTASVSNAAPPTSDIAVSDPSLDPARMRPSLSLLRQPPVPGMTHYQPSFDGFGPGYRLPR
ncbi:MAG TPA: hypothetical protein VIJ23_01865 [Mycobacterium sp.]